MTLAGDSRKTSYPSNWKKYFLSLPQNSWLCDISDDFINDNFNLYGLEADFQYFSACKDVITGAKKLDRLSAKVADKLFREELEKAYGLIHARYIISPEGIQQMKEKYFNKEFGTCPRFECQKEPLLPYGKSSTLRTSRVKGFCPRCRQVYYPRPVMELDGAYFGPNAAHILIDNLGIIGRCLHNEPFKLQVCGYSVYDPRK